MMDDWKENKKLVLSTLERLDATTTATGGKVDKLIISVVKLETIGKHQGKMWGIISGGVISIVITIIGAALR